MKGFCLGAFPTCIVSEEKAVAATLQITLCIQTTLALFPMQSVHVLQSDFLKVITKHGTFFKNGMGRGIGGKKTVGTNR